ncbi:3'(2'),5'-bisphosphate nucleotidase CysQ [Dyella sp.]|jgi:3'(2'), 5'-bisphosphate nucleotidase|uniref:3'(2'),5'-bisphosphate nucleotidase CysQ n=1 Tax=Dyella sp. TaxID=1869338 RepID=UPI002D76D0DB|nr:3'(2'),5'-bisphosphate nucleotidase CysQ [Dyella sp.]HET6433248.1 3'(2'),5'-bisphosphate nucleotidase CysQ [Dyella sp.]
MSGSSLSPLLLQVTDIAAAAAVAIMEIYASDFAVQHKDDRTPLTAADLAAQAVIAKGLAELGEVLPVVSEEARASDWSVRRQWSRYWLVDPLDGTREFVKRNGEFTVNIALIERHRPVLGVVLAPVTGDAYVAQRGAGAWRREGSAPWQPLRSRALARPPVVAGSRSHGGTGEALLDALLGGPHEPLPMGSSLKFCLIARADADVYLRRGPTSEWDTAAAQCVLEEAGGAVLDLEGAPLRYNRGESLLNPEFIAVGDTEIDWAARLAASIPG